MSMMIRLFSVVLLTLPGLPAYGQTTFWIKLVDNASNLRESVETQAGYAVNFGEYQIEYQTFYTARRQYGSDSDQVLTASIERHILRYIDRLHVGSDDAVVFQYIGHGANDQEKGGLYYDLSNGEQILKIDIRDAIGQKRPRLIVMLNDCCNGYDSMRTRAREPEEGIAMYDESAAELYLHPPLTRSLFLRSYGVVDIAANRDGDYSLAMPEGTFFGTAFHKTFDDNWQRELSWSQFYALLNRQSTQTFRSKYGNGFRDRASGISINNIVPVYYMLPNSMSSSQLSGMASRSSSGFDLGTQVEAFGTGVKVTYVTSGSRGEDFGFEKGDVIYTVDDYNVRTAREFDDAIRAFSADGKLKFTLRCGTRGKMLVYDFPNIYKNR